VVDASLVFHSPGLISTVVDGQVYTVAGNFENTSAMSFEPEGEKKQEKEGTRMAHRSISRIGKEKDFLKVWG
jgi:hypothetical protein